MNGARPSFVVDGSNIATEGRSLPSLAQLDAAVTALLRDYPIESLTVVVDATFAHRIDSSERQHYEDALEAGELIAPPAGTVGRGDAFLLQVAERAEATVFSNDSFQEFHGEHAWLFEPDRLLGGKPVEGIGWIFIKRIPVRGPKSRQASQQARRQRSKAKRTKQSKRPGAALDIIADVTSQKDSKKNQKNSKNDRRGAKGRNRRSEGVKAETSKKKSSGKGGKQSKKKPDKKSPDLPENKKSNDARSFLEFVTRYSIGDTAEGVVDRFASHGCYVKTGAATCYLPSRSMGDPPPAKARDLVSLGQNLKVRVQSYDPDRRGINVTLATIGPRPHRTGNTSLAKPSNISQSEKRNKSANEKRVPSDGPSREPNLTRSNIVATKNKTKKATKKAPTKKVAKATSSQRVKQANAKKAPAKKATAKKGTKKVAKKAATKKAAVKKRPAKKATKKVAKKAATKKAATKKAAAKKAAVKKRPAKKATKKVAKKAAAKKRPAKKAATKKKR